MRFPVTISLPLAAMLISACATGELGYERPPNENLVPLFGAKPTPYVVEDLARYDADLAGYEMQGEEVVTPIGNFNYRMCRVTGPDSKSGFFKRQEGTAEEWIYESAFSLFCTNYPGFAQGLAPHEEDVSLPDFQARMNQLLRPVVYYPRRYGLEMDCQLRVNSNSSPVMLSEKEGENSSRGATDHQSIQLYLTVTLNCLEGDLTG